MITLKGILRVNRGCRRANKSLESFRLLSERRKTRDDRRWSWSKGDRTNDPRFPGARLLLIALALRWSRGASKVKLHRDRGDRANDEGTTTRPNKKGTGKGRDPLQKLSARRFEAFSLINLRFPARFCQHREQSLSSFHTLPPLFSSSHQRVSRSR